jgi:amidase
MSLALDEYRQYDAAGLAELVASNQVTGEELVAAAAEAAERVNPSINAIVELYPETERTPVPTSGLWRGVPYVVKDIAHLDVGRKVEYGSRLGLGLRSTRTTHLLSRLQHLGLVPVGRSATSELAVAGVTETVAFGPTRTPWQLARNAGGSSGGSAAAIAAGIVPVAVGSDGGGSIRIPASCCGIIGLKPTRGRISSAPWGDPLAGFASSFLLTRSVRDTETALLLLSGSCPGDQYPLPPLVITRAKPFPRRRIRLMTESPAGLAVDHQVVKSTRQVAQHLESLGHEVDEGSPTIEWHSFVDAMGRMWASDVARMAHDLAERSGRKIDDETLEPQTLAIYRQGRSLSAQALLDAGQVFNQVNRSIGAFFQDFDILITPTLGQLPPPVGRYNPNEDRTASSFFQSWADVEAFLPLFNCSGQPAMSLPLGWSSEGLPIGVQLVADHGHEEMLLQIAYELEDSFGPFPIAPVPQLSPAIRVERQS